MSSKIDQNIQEMATNRAKQLCDKLGVNYSEINKREGIKQDAKKVIAMKMKKEGYYLKHIGNALHLPTSNVSRAIKTGNELLKQSEFFKRLNKLI